MIGLFMKAIALFRVIGAPLSSWILVTFAGVSGLKSWQWLFILQALPAIVIGIATYFYLTDRAHDAQWLMDDAARLATDASREAIWQIHVRPIPETSGRWQGKSFIDGGRAGRLIHGRYGSHGVQSTPESLPEPPSAAGKAKKVAIIAVAPKLLTISTPS